MKRMLVMIIIYLFFSGESFADHLAYLLVPKCFREDPFAFTTLYETKSARLIKTRQFKQMQSHRYKLAADCRHFINVTQVYQEHVLQKKETISAFVTEFTQTKNSRAFEGGYLIQFQPEVNQLILNVKKENLAKCLSQLTQYPDRDAYSIHGLKSAKWLHYQIQTLIHTATRDDLELLVIPTTNGAEQYSLVLKIGKALRSPGIALSAHIDTLPSQHELQPGADNTASGVASLFEALRIIINSPLHFDRPIYFIFYAGGEAGLLGAQSVLEYFNHHKLTVEALLQLNETGYEDKEGGIGLAGDYTDAGLTAFVADLVRTYLRSPVGAVRCPYACSDHVLWFQEGISVAYPFTTMRDEGNPNIYTKKDKLETLSLEHVSDFAKLALAFAIELGLRSD